MNIPKKQLIKIIREELVREAEEGLSNVDFSKQMKTGAADIAASVPTKLNDDASRMIEILVAMAKFDRAAFNKIKGYMDNLGAKALEKSQKGEKPEDSTE